MGTTISRELEDGLREARLKAERSRAEREEPLEVDDILFGDEKYVKILAAVWRSLPSTSKTKVSGRRTRTNKAISKSKSATKITLSDNDKQYLVSWKAAPSTFFQRHEEFQFHLQEDPLAQVYNSLSALDKIHTVNRIQRRILLVVIHRLKKKIFQSGLIKENHDSILRNITSWAKAGARYDTLARNLEGLGALALLPGDIGTTIWEVTLAMTGETHIQMVASLKERGICNEAQKIWDVPGDCHTQTSVNEIVDELFNYLWALVDQPAWTEAPLSKDNNSGLLVTAADVEINGRENLQHSGSGSYTTPSNQNESAGFPTAQPHWTPDFRHPSFLPSAAQDDLNTLTSCQSRPQPDTNYDLTEVTPYGSSLPGLDLTTYQPLSQPRINYNLTEVTPYGSSQFSNLNELCPQPNTNYNLVEVTPYGSSEPNSLNGSCSQPNINYSLTEATLYGSALIGPNPEPRAHFPTLPTAIQ